MVQEVKAVAHKLRNLLDDDEDDDEDEDEHDDHNDDHDEDEDDEDDKVSREQTVPKVLRELCMAPLCRAFTPFAGYWSKMKRTKQAKRGYLRRALFSAIDTQLASIPWRCRLPLASSHALLSRYSLFGRG